MDAAEKLPGGASGAGQWVKTGALDANTRDTLIQLVEDVQMATGANEVVIMGTKAALSKVTGLQNVEWISDDMKKERHTTGKMGMWEGIRLNTIGRDIRNYIEKQCIELLKNPKVVLATT